MGSVVAHTLIDPIVSGGGTSTPFDSTGADLIVIAIAQEFAVAYTFSDNQGNTYNSGPGRAFGLTLGGKFGLFFCFAPVTSPTHTVTLGGGTHGQAACILAISGAGALDPANSGAGVLATTTIQPGSVTGSGSGPDLVLTAVGYEGNNTSFMIDSGFTISDDNAARQTVHYGIALGYKFQGSPSAENPTWTSATTGNMGAVACTISVSGDFTLDADQGSFTETGESALWKRGFVAESGSYVETGLPASFKTVAGAMVADPGYFVLTGFATNEHLNEDFILDAMPGFYIVTGGNGRFCKAKDWPRVDCSDDPWVKVKTRSVS